MNAHTSGHGAARGFETHGTIGRSAARPIRDPIPLIRDSGPARRDAKP